MGMLSILIEQEVKKRFASIATHKNLRVAVDGELRIEPGENVRVVGNEPTQLVVMNDDQIKALAEGLETALIEWLNAIVTAPPPSGKVVVPPSGGYYPP